MPRRRTPRSGLHTRNHNVPGRTFMLRRGFATALVAGLLALLCPSRALAQSAITGLVKDATGAVLPGVTVEASSDALIERVRGAVSDPQGRFAIVDLRPGTY